MTARPPPVAVAILCAAGAWWLAHRLPGWRLDAAGRGIVAIALAATGAIIALGGVMAFRRARTTVDPLRPECASALVTDGIYAHTRNPMYLGLAVVLLGWGVWLANPSTILAIAAFVAWIDRFQILPEERALSAAFGAEFERYRRRVRRWI